MAINKPTTTSGTSGNNSYTTSNQANANDENWNELWSNHAVACDSQGIGPVFVHTIAYRQGLVDGATKVSVTNKTKQLCDADDPGLVSLDVGTSLTTNLGHASEASLSICSHRCIWADQNYGVVT